MAASTGLSLALIAAGYAAGIIVYILAPGPYFAEPSFAATLAFLLPTAAAGTYAALRMVDKDPLYATIALYVVLFVIALHATLLVAFSGLDVDGIVAARIVLVLLGLLLMGVGNLLPQTRPNLAVGIRTRRLLDDRLLWTRFHRIVGYVSVACGALIFSIGAFLPVSIFRPAIDIAFVASLAVVISFYRRYAHA